MLFIIRWLAGHFFMLPFVLAYYVLSVPFGKQTARKTVGRLLTGLSETFLGLAMPKIHDSKEFPEFKKQVVRLFKGSKILYDVEVEKEGPDFVQLKLLNCPFTSALKDFGVSELCGYACAGDNRIAQKNKEKWKFRKTHSHGTDGKCCDHTYYSLQADAAAGDIRR